MLNYIGRGPGQLSLAILSSVGAMSTRKSWDVNRHTVRCTSPVSVVWQCKLVSDWGLIKRRSAPLYGPHDSGRTLRRPTFTITYIGRAINIDFSSRPVRVSATFSARVFRCSGKKKNRTGTVPGTGKTPPLRSPTTRRRCRMLRVTSLLEAGATEELMSLVEKHFAYDTTHTLVIYVSTHRQTDRQRRTERNTERNKQTSVVYAGHNVFTARQVTRKSLTSLQKKTWS